jgi:hypothetical protein
MRERVRKANGVCVSFEDSQIEALRLRNSLCNQVGVVLSESMLERMGIRTQKDGRCLYIR